MLSDEQLWVMAACHGISYHRQGPIDAIGFARAIEQEATAEATRIMREWVEAKDAVLNWQNKNVMYRPLVSMVQRVAAAEQAIRDFVERMK